MSTEEKRYTLRQTIGITLISWFSMIGFDLLLHAGILANFYFKPHPFLLAPMEAFRLIPVGYLSFLLLAVLLVWLMQKLEIRGPGRGALFGLQCGALIWGAEALGLLSISTADPALLAGWFIGQTLELGLAGVFAGAGFSGRRPLHLFFFALLVMIIAVAIVVTLQSLGIAPAIRVDATSTV